MVTNLVDGIGGMVAAFSTAPSPSPLLLLPPPPCSQRSGVLLQGTGRDRNPLSELCTKGSSGVCLFRKLQLIQPTQPKPAGTAGEVVSVLPGTGTFKSSSEVKVSSKRQPTQKPICIIQTKHTYEMRLSTMFRLGRDLQKLQSGEKQTTNCRVR